MAPKAVHSAFRQAIFPGRAAVVGAGYILVKTAACHNRDFPHYALVYLLEGGGVYEDPQFGRREVNQGDAIVVFPHRIHSYYGRPGLIWSECFLVFEGRLFEQLEADGVLNPREPVLTPGYLPELTMRLQRLYDGYQAVDTPHDPGLVAELHLTLARIRQLHDVRLGTAGPGAANAHRSAGTAAAVGPLGDARQREFVARACRRLEADLDREPAWESLAAEFSLSYERFRKRFTQAAGLPPAKYRLLRRIDRAKQLLIETELSMKEIAGQLGFCDAFFFSRQFKQVTGRTPTHFRTQL